MLSRDVAVESPDFHGLSRVGTFPARTFAALSRTDLAGRFVPWEGQSGRSYVFSVYAASDCPAFCDAVLIAAVRDERGRRQALDLVDTGPFPEPALLRARRDLGRRGGALEFHVHLLSRTPAERREAIADLAAALFPCGARPPGDTGRAAARA